jgi:hypothetical protein
MKQRLITQDEASNMLKVLTMARPLYYRMIDLSAKDKQLAQALKREYRLLSKKFLFKGDQLVTLKVKQYQLLKFIMDTLKPKEEVNKG